MKQNYKYIGKSVPRQDAVQKVQGRAMYAGDMVRPNMVYAKLVLSKEPNATIEVHKESVLHTPGVIAVYTHEDIPHVGYNPYEWFFGVESVRDEYILSKEALHVGDRIALVVAESQELANQAAHDLEITYTPRPAVLTLDEAMSDTVSTKGEGSNKGFEKDIVAGDADAKLAEAHYIFEDTGMTQKIHHAAIEPHTVMATPDEHGNLEVYTPCQTVFLVRMHVSRVVGLPVNRVRAIKATMGGSFGGKGQVILEPIAAFVAHSLGRPVMLAMSREDVIQAAVCRNPARIHTITGLDKEGKVIGRRINAYIDGGAYHGNGSAVTMALGKKAFRLYDIQDQTYHGEMYYTNTVMGGSCRGYGSPQLHAVTEVHMDRIAHELGIDPCDFRLKNVVRPGAKDPSGATDLGDARIVECIEKGRAQFRWDERKAHVKEKDTHRYAYGVGMAVGTHGNGYKGAFPDFSNVDMEILPDGTVYLRVAAHDQGCGTITTFQQIAAEVLDVDYTTVRMLEADTFVAPYDAAGTQASRVTYVVGATVKLAAEAMKEKLAQAYSTLTGLAPSAVIIAKGTVSAEGAETMTFGELSVAYETQRARNLHVSVEHESPSNPAVYAAGFAEVRVDKYTGLVDVVDLLCVQDIGQTINRQLAEGQVEGGAHMSIGQCLTEEISIDGKGQVKATNFSKYHVINAPSMPPMKVDFVEEGNSDGPFGAKSVGEMAAVVPSPAIANAITHALGVRIWEYPLTPEKIIAAMVAQDA